MRRILLNKAPLQELSFDFAGEQLRLTVRYNSVGQHWAMDIYDLARQHWVTQGLSLVVGVPMLWRQTTAYFFWLSDESGTGLDATLDADLGSRCRLYIGDKAEVLT